MMSPDLTRVAAFCVVVGGCNCGGGNSAAPDAPVDAAAADASGDGMLPDARTDAGMTSCAPRDVSSCASTVDGGDIAPVANRLSVTVGVKWTRDFSEAVSVPILLESAGKLAAIINEASNYVVLISAQNGSDNLMIPGLDSESLGWSLSADPAENVYFVGNRVYSITANGTPRWFHPLRGPLPSNRPAGRSPVVSPQGLFVGGADGRVYRLDPATGGEVWSVPVSTANCGGGCLEFELAGRGDTVFVPSADYGYVALDAATGSIRWHGPGCQFGNASSMILTQDSLLGNEYQSASASLVGYALDRCGQTTLRKEGSALFGLIDRQLHLVSLIGFSPTQQLVITDLNTGSLLGPALDIGEPNAAAWLVAVGADDTAYIYECYNRDQVTQRSRIIPVRLGSTLVRETSIELGTSCEGEPSHASLGTDGVLYVATRTALVAVQTKSPGPAQSPWPLPHADNRGSKWVGP